MDDLKLVENEIVPIYENTGGAKLINARELHSILLNKRQFSDWIKQRIKQYEFVENREFFKHHNFVKVGNLKRPQIDYYLTVDMAKELCMIENNKIGKKLRRYFIEVEKRYQKIIDMPNNIFDFMRLAINQIEINENRLMEVEKKTNKYEKQMWENKERIKNLTSKIDVIIKKNYCLASDIAEQIGIYSENNLPHSNFIGAIARQLGMKLSYKHYYEDDKIAIVPDLSKGNNYYQVYYKPKAVKEIIEWFDNNKEDIEYKIVYQKNTKKGVKGEIKEQGFKIENVCYKIILKK